MGQPGIDSMKLFDQLKRNWLEDKLLRTVVRNSSYLFSSNTVSMGLTFFQGIMAAALLGPSNYGTLGVIISFASNVNRLLSFRMNEIVVKYGGQYLEEGRKDLAGAVIKLAAIAEAVTSVVAYGLLILLARWGAETIVKDPVTAPWIIFYGLALLANLMTETSTAVLQLGGHFRTQALFNLLQNILTASWIFAAYLLKGNVFDVILAYLAGKFLFGMGVMISSFYWLKPLVGDQWWKADLHSIPQIKRMLRFAASTNLSGTVNMLIRDSELLWLGYFLTTLEAGYYKFGLAMMNVIILPILPFIQTTFPEITRSVTNRSWAALKSLLKKTSLIALILSGLVVVGLVLFGPWFLNVYSGGEYLPALPVIWVLFLGYTFGNIFYWNRPLLLALNRPNLPLAVTFSVGLIKTILMVMLVSRYGVNMQAWLLTGYFVVSIGLVVISGLRNVHQEERKDAMAGGVS